MNNKQWTITGTSLLLGLSACAMNAEAACSDARRVLNLGVNAITLLQRDTRCVLAAATAQSGTFEIKVKTEPGYNVDLTSIAIDAKDSDGPLTFKVDRVKQNQKILVVLVTWVGSPPQTAEYGYTVTVPDLGVLDPKVQIIRTSPLIQYSTALRKLAEEYLDEAAYEFIARELLPIEEEAAAE